MRGWPGLEDRASQVLVLARPVLSKILASADEPSMLRLMAMRSYLPGIIYSNDALVNPPAFLSTERTEDLLTALRTRDKLSGGIRYLIVNTLAEHFGHLPEDAGTFVSAMQSLLSDSDPHERLLAALKDVLLAELKARTTDRSHIAAQGLGKLGAQAADAVPDLLAYAEATKDLGNGSADGALEAACRLQPDLRAQYPEIDAKLKQEENAISRRAETKKDYGSGEVASALADSEQGHALRDSFISAIKNSPEPGKTRQSFVSALEKELQHAPESQRAAVQSTIDAVRQIDTSIKSEETERRPIPMSSLVLDARVMLVDSANPNKDKLDGRLNELLVHYRQIDANSSVTTERFRVLSEAIRSIDPEFQSLWQKQVLQNYPWLDRILPGEKE